MIGHELTALHGLDHALTLALVEPSLMEVMRAEKGDKIVQYGERIWNITEGTKDVRIDAAIKKTAEFFESLGVVLSMSHYGVTKESVDEICNRFELRKSKLGENGTITHIEVRKILEKAF